MRKKLTKRKEYPEIIENLIGITISSIVGIAITFLLFTIYKLHKMFYYRNVNIYF